MQYDILLSSFILLLVCLERNHNKDENMLCDNIHVNNY